MRHFGWIIVFCLGAIWAYLDLYGTNKLPIVHNVISKEIENQDPLKQPVEAGYVPGKSPDAHKAKAHIIKTLRDLPEQGQVEIISQKILTTPRPDGSWTEEWVVKKGSTEIALKIDFGVTDIDSR
jgi:hypothetical protein